MQQIRGGENMNPRIIVLAVTLTAAIVREIMKDD
jgi:hypothetical protein